MDLDWPNIVFVTTGSADEFSGLQAFWIAAFGAIVGGSIAFATTLYFHLRERRQRQFELSWAFYLALMSVFNDVFSVSSRYFEALGSNCWPTEPWTRMPELLGDSGPRFEISPELLSTVSGPHAQGLVNDVLEQVNFRNFILAAAKELSRRKSTLMTNVADRSELGPGMSITTGLDPEKDKALIMEIRTLNDLAKQLLSMILRFEDRQADLAIRYNTYTQNHPLRKVRGFKAEFQVQQPWHHSMPTTVSRERASASKL